MSQIFSLKMIKKSIKKSIPKFILKYREKYIVKKTRNQFLHMNNNEIFKKIYLEKLWCPENEKKNFKFYSGIGSHSSELFNKYISSVKDFILSLPEKPNVVDLGCGDFAIGSKIRKFCNNYIAVDIYDELIQFNKEKYKDLNVDFRIFDMTQDLPPSADICFVRQVLQHLSNESINNFLKLSKNKYKYLVVTEHFPISKNFVANIDKPTGWDIRYYDNSAVDLTAPPFNLKTISDVNLCEIYSDTIEGFLKTRLLQMKK
jgi:SAM-dependent methyltransferase